MDSLRSRLYFEETKTGAGMSIRIARRPLFVGFGMALAAPASAQQAPAASGARVRIGVLTDMSGPFSAISGPGAVAAARSL